MTRPASSRMRVITTSACCGRWTVARILALATFTAGSWARVARTASGSAGRSRSASKTGSDASRSRPRFSSVATVAPASVSIRRRWPSRTKFSSASQRRKAVASSTATSASAVRSIASIGAKSATAARTSRKARASASRSAPRSSGSGASPRFGVGALPGASAMRIMLSRAPSPTAVTRPSASRVSGMMGCSSWRTTRPRRASAASALSTRKGMSSVTISTTGAAPRPGPGGRMRSFASPGVRVVAKAKRLAAASASVSGAVAASSAVGTAAKRRCSSPAAAGGKAGAARCSAASAAASRPGRRPSSGAGASVMARSSRGEPAETTGADASTGWCQSRARGDKLPA
ncbi:MAG: hypothetical protein RLZZ187_221 [Pseudomonadota bacterium]